MLKVSGNAVCQISFEICPDKFIGIKLRRISWEVKGLDSRIAFKEPLDELGSVERASVPEKDDRAFEVTAKVSEKLPDLFSPDVLVGVKTRVEAKTFSLGRDRDGGDSRDFCPASGDHERRRFSFNRPGSLEIRDKRESALIQEDQAGSKPNGLFLYEAKRAVYSNESLLPGALWPSSAASGNSSPSRPSDSKDLRCNNSLGNSCARSDRSVSRSKDPSNSQLPRGLSPKCAPRFSFACPTKVGVGPCAAWDLIPRALSSGKLDANALRSLEMRPLPELRPGTDALASKAGWPDADVFPVFGDCHEVSLCPPRLPLYDRLEMVSIESRKFSSTFHE